MTLRPRGCVRASPMTRAALLALLALLVLPLALAPRAEAFVYWTDVVTGEIGRANLDGSGVDKSFIPQARSALSVAVGGAHVYWTSPSTGTIGRANLDGSGVDQSFISGPTRPEWLAV